MWDLHHELVLFLQRRTCFCYVPENEIKREILVFTTSNEVPLEHIICHNKYFGIFWEEGPKRYWYEIVSYPNKEYQEITTLNLTVD